MEKQKIKKNKLTDLLSQFVGNAAISGIILIAIVIIALIWANSNFGESYFMLWEKKIVIGFGDAVLSKPLLLWINDGLMAMFFFVIGLEIKREVMAGELSSWKQASMPIFAALGGMLLPAALYLLFNLGKTSSNGWGIPMATDIAFSLGVLALLGKRVPLSLKIFLTAFAIVDDIGAVIVIALFYSSNIILSNLIIGGLFLGVMVIMNIAGVRNKLAYAIPGILGIWLAFLLSGVHATIAGVLAALVIPASTTINKVSFKKTISGLTDKIDDLKKNHSFLSKKEQGIVTEIKNTCEYYEPPVQSLEHTLHPWVVFLIMPIFALSNTGVLIGHDFFNVMTEPSGLGIIVGLLIGKPLGIMLFSWLAYKSGIALLPEGTKWIHVLGIGFLGGIGFTMSLFVASLAFKDPELVTTAKVSILFASVLAGLLGFLILRKTLTRQENK